MMNNTTVSTTSMETFYRLIFTYPEAVNLLKTYYKSKLSGGDRSSCLNNLHVFSKNYLEAGLEAVLQGIVHVIVVHVFII